jgi:hypothetical protein
VERAGDYSLPAIDIRWLNVGSGKIEEVHLDAVPLKVAGDPTARTAAPIDGAGRSWTWEGFVDLVADHWLAGLFVAIIVAALGWFAPGMGRRIADYHRRRRAAYLQSEAFAFSRFRYAVRRRDAKAAYFAMLDWLPHVGATTPDHTVEAFKLVARDPVMDHEIDAIEAELFAAQADAGRWSRRQLLRRVRAARQRLRPRAGRSNNSRLPQQLNPAGASSVSAQFGRRPAR